MSSGNDNRLASLLDAATQAHRDGHLDTAERLYREVCRLQPHHAQALSLLGVALHTGGRIVEALPLLARATDLAPGAPDAWANRAHAEFSSGAYDLALASANRCLALSPRHPLAAFVQGNILERNGALAPAIKAYRLAIGSQPAFLAAREALYRLDAPTLQETDWLDQAIDIQPDNPAWPPSLALTGNKMVESRLGKGNFAQADIARQILKARHLSSAEQDASWRIKVRDGFGIGKNAVSDQQAYLLIRPWSKGFWSDVDHVLGQLLVAELADRRPVVYWGESSYYGGTQSMDAFSCYFDPVCPVAAAQLPWDAGSVFPREWNRSNYSSGRPPQWNGPDTQVSGLALLGRSETIVVSDFFTQILQLIDWIPAENALYGKSIHDVYRYLIEKYLRPRADLVVEAETAVGELFGASPFLAIHLRGLDKVDECSNLAKLNSGLIEQAGHLIDARPEMLVYCLTDDTNMLDEAARTFGPRMRSCAFHRASGQHGIHFTNPKASQLAHGREMMVDTLVACHAQHFFGLGLSNVAAMIARLKDWPEGTLHLSERNLQESFNLALFDW